MVIFEIFKKQFLKFVHTLWFIFYLFSPQGEDFLWSPLLENMKVLMY